MVLTRLDRSMRPATMPRAVFSMESGYQMAKKLFTDHPDIDTLLCATDTIASGALAVFPRAGNPGSGAGTDRRIW